MSYTLNFKYQEDGLFLDTKVFYCHIIFEAHPQLQEVRFKIQKIKTANPHDCYEMHVNTRAVQTNNYYDRNATLTIQKQVNGIFAPMELNYYACEYHIDLYHGDKESALFCAEALFKTFSITPADQEKIREFINTGILTEHYVLEQVKALYLKNDLIGAIQLNHDFMAKGYRDKMCDLGNQFVQNKLPQDAYNCYSKVIKNSPRFDEAQENIRSLIAGGKCTMIENIPNEKSTVVTPASFFSPSNNNNHCPSSNFESISFGQ